jgi:hypothetical protein
MKTPLALLTFPRLLPALAALCFVTPVLAQAPQKAVPQIPPRPEKGEMSFFITSVGLGDGANLGGLAGADAHCQKLAAESGQPGAEGRTWRAYLSTQAAPGVVAVNARDRIGQGPWYNAKGVRIAVNNADLHGDTIELARKGNILNINTALDEFGNRVAGEVRIVGMEGMRNQHDILTGTKADGTAFTDDFDRTCSNWTSSAETGSANVGHHDRLTSFTSMSWNDAHASIGCSQDNLIATGGAGQFYCFAVD